ncbi:DNA polymerase III subunit gamma/tau [Roseimaritima ulvae]|uniref:DNA polymerase III subunit gamma/tau n=1 Tax=Roseimaritima ulvae TaxID=980254 RepID=A0A5B9QTB4_9BACT|nr:DNA polymerase III subunit gamma/tau [Roseimaritima ulvae]QEG41152.1 DNA polymerase III subunit tau [Roseimaritima ulvae]
MAESDSTKEPTSDKPTSDKYVVVARRYRPKNFGELVGQGHVGQALKNAIETNRVGHAYLFTGARGVGKTSTARIFAKALNAPEGPTATPDNDSDICQSIDAGEDVDVLEIDGASNRGIDEIRSLRAGVGVRPSRSRYKIYIIDEVHMLTQAAFNALLKTLEEPPPHVKFIFCTTDPEKIPITVLSRCQRFDFAPVHTDEIMGRLREIVDAENAQADDEALRLIARRAAGSMRDSQSLLEQVLSFSSGGLTVESVHSMLGTADDQRLHELTTALIARDAKSALEQADAAILAGVDAGQLGEQLLGHFRDLMVATVGCPPTMLRYCGESMHDELKQRGENWGVPTILAVVSLLDQTLVRIRQSVHSRVLLETALIQICQLPDLQRIADLMAGASSKRPAIAAAEKKNIEMKAAAAPVASPVPAVARPPAGQTSPAAAPVGTASPASSPAALAGSSPAKPVATAGGNAAAAADAAEKKLPTSYPPPQWTDAGVQQMWQWALERMDEMTAGLARQYSKIQLIQEGRVRLLFPSNMTLTKTRCDKPEQKNKLEEAISFVAARRVLIELGFDAQAVVKPTAKPPSTAGERRQRQRQLQTHPWVKKCMEIFDAEVVRVDEPRSS